jgi:hypothetical protein
MQPSAKSLLLNAKLRSRKEPLAGVGRSRRMQRPLPSLRRRQRLSWAFVNRSRKNMASENLGHILFDAEVVADVGALRDLLANGQVKQGDWRSDERRLRKRVLRLHED